MFRRTLFLIIKLKTKQKALMALVRIILAKRQADVLTYVPQDIEI